MILIDQNEPMEFDYYLSQSCDIDRGNWNQSPGKSEIYPDFTILAGGKSIGINRKQTAEVLGGMEEWEEQVFRELSSSNIDMLICVIEGAFVSHGGGLMAVSLQDIGTKAYKDKKNLYHIEATGLQTQWTYKNIAGKFIRMYESGIPVILHGSILDSAIFMAELHSVASRQDWDSPIFTKLFKHRHFFNEDEKRIRDYKEFLYSIPGIGEEMIKSLIEEFPTFYEMYEYMVTNGASLAPILMPSGRRIGPAADRKIREFWGVPTD